MKIEEFRIVENSKGFQVQIKANYKERKYFFSKQVEKEDYFPINIIYEADICNSYLSPPRIRRFKSYEEAVNLIKRLCEPEKIHYPPF